MTTVILLGNDGLISLCILGFPNMQYRFFHESEDMCTKHCLF